MRESGHTITKARPTISDVEIGPKERLSSESQRLSPMTNTSPFGTVSRPEVLGAVAVGRNIGLLEWVIVDGDRRRSKR